MANADNYAGASGSIIRFGSYAITPAITPLRSGGTVAALASAFTGHGFQLLTTAPASPTYRGYPHSGSVWDEDRQTMWLFGADTHTTEADMDNAVYGWRASDGKFVKHYDADPTSGYRMDTNGVIWSSAAHIRPIGMHTFRTLRFIPGQNEIESTMDEYQGSHTGSGITFTFENGSQTIADRVPQFWYYNITTGAWRHSTLGAGTTQFIGVSSNIIGAAIGYVSGYGWFLCDGSWWVHLSEAGVYSQTNISGKSIAQIQSYFHISPDGSTVYDVGGVNGTYLYSKHPLADVTTSVRYAASSYAALSGMNLVNMASCMMGDGRILIFPFSGTTYHAMILDPVANTVTDTGHTLAGMDGSTAYELTCEWSPSLNCALLLTKRFSPNRMYGYRP